VRLVTFEAGVGERLGALIAGDRVLDLAAAGDRLGIAVPVTMQALIEADAPGLDAARRIAEIAPDEAIAPLAAVHLLAPLPRPVRLRDCCLFLEHMEVALDKLGRRALADAPDLETALAEAKAQGRYALVPAFKDQVIYYNADHVNVVGTGVDIVWPAYSDWMDFELEWACVIGRPGRDIARADASDHIFGYTIFNDWSARDAQLSFMAANLGPGEGKDFANGIGPCIATPDEFADPYALEMTAHVNGERWSRGSTASMHHRFEDAIVQFSRSRTLSPGEILGSGTVLGGCGFELDRSLADGDLVELHIEGIGTLGNRVVRR